LVFGRPPQLQDIAVVFPLLAFLILGGLAWLDQRIWPPRRPLAQGTVAFRTVLAIALSLTFLFAVIRFAFGDGTFDETTVLPLPPNLTLVSRAESCGSESCSVTYVLSTPDGVSIGELSSRLWRHLEGKGWQRQRANASCRDIGWLNPVHQCLFLRQDTPGVATLHLSTALDLPPEPS
jgi:hypothetical protein